MVEVTSGSRMSLNRLPSPVNCYLRSRWWASAAPTPTSSRLARTCSGARPSSALRSPGPDHPRTRVHGHRAAGRRRRRRIQRGRPCRVRRRHLVRRVRPVPPDADQPVRALFDRRPVPRRRPRRVRHGPGRNMPAGSPVRTHARRCGIGSTNVDRGSRAGLESELGPDSLQFADRALRASPCDPSSGAGRWRLLHR